MRNQGPSPGESPHSPGSVAPFLLAALLVMGLRVLLVSCSGDRIHPVDPAELSMAEIHRLLLSPGQHPLQGVLYLSSRAANLHHGGYLPLSLAYSALARVMGDSYLTLKMMAVFWSTATWLAWVWLALRLGGRRAAWLMALAMALPVPWATQWWLTLWGSHPEASLFTALWIGFFLWEGATVEGVGPATRRQGLVLGALMGLSAGFAPILTPTALLCTAFWCFLRRPGRAVLMRVLFWAILAWLPFQSGSISNHLGFLLEPLTEDPSNSLLQILARGMDPGMFLETLSQHLPLPLAPHEQAGSWAVPNLFLNLVAAISAAVVIFHLLSSHYPRHENHAAAWIIIILPVAHLITVILFSPFRPELQYRYLLPWFPAFLLWPVLAGSLLRPRIVSGLFLGVALVPTLFSLPCYRDLLDLDRIRYLHDYRPWSYLQMGLDRVPFEYASQINRFMESRNSQGNEPFYGGFAEMVQPRSGYPLPCARDGMKPDPHPWQRLNTTLSELENTTAGNIARLGRNAGWAIGIVEHWEPGACLEMANRLGRFRRWALRGIGEGLVASEQESVFLQVLDSLDPSAARLVEIGLMEHPE